MTELKNRLMELGLKSEFSNPVDKILNELDGETREILHSLLRNKAVSTRSIYDELKDAGYKIGRDTIDRYRRKLNQ